MKTKDNAGKFKFKRIPHWCGGTGMVWLIIHSDGTEQRTIMSASGPGMYTKARMEKDYNGTKS